MTYTHPDPNTPGDAPVPYYIDYVDPDGFTWVLFDPRYTAMTQGWYPKTDGTGKAQGGYVCSAISGIEGLPVTMQTLPMLDGTAQPLLYIPQTGTIGLGVVIGRPMSGTQWDYYDLLDSFTHAFFNRRNMNPAPGTLRIRRPGAKGMRQIQVFCTSGLNTPEVGLNDTTLYTLALSTPDPYWSDTGPTQLTYPALKSFPGILPINFVPPSPAGIAFNQTTDTGVFNLYNYGNGPAYPIWLINGPGLITVTNNSMLYNGVPRAWSLNQTIAAGHTVQLVTQRGHQTCQDITNPSSPVNLWSQLVFTGPHDLFPLMVGNNKLLITVTGANANTAVNVAYTNRYARA